MTDNRTRSAARRFRWKPAALFMLIPGLLMVWSLVSLRRLDHRETVTQQFAEKGIRVTYEDSQINECSFLRRCLIRFPGGLGFSRPLLIDAQRSTFGDDGVELLHQVPDLRRLWLWESQVSDVALAKLPPMPYLESFSAPTVATERGLVCLKNFPSLKSLQLVQADISPAVVDWILRMHNLKDLDLRGSKIESKQVERLRESNRNLRIQI